MPYSVQILNIAQLTIHTINIKKIGHLHDLSSYKHLLTMLGRVDLSCLILQLYVWFLGKAEPM